MVGKWGGDEESKAIRIGVGKLYDLVRPLSVGRFLASGVFASMGSQSVTSRRCSPSAILDHGTVVVGCRRSWLRPSIQ